MQTLKALKMFDFDGVKQVGEVFEATQAIASELIANGLAEKSDAAEAEPAPTEATTSKAKKA